MMAKTRLIPRKRDITKPLIKTLALLLLSLSVIGLCSVVLSIYISKPIGDDFGAITYYRPDVWLENTWQSLLTTGRYGQSLLGAITYGAFGDKVSNILPLITLVWFMAIIYVYIKYIFTQYFRINTLTVNYLSAVSTILLAFLTLFINKSVENINPPTWMTYQLFFWPSGIVTYTLPVLVLLTAVYLIFIKRNGLSRIKKILFFSLALFFTGLFNETQPATLIGLAIATFGLSFMPFLKTLIPYRKHLLVTACASSLALLTLLFSPGSQKRQAATGVLERGDVVGGVVYNFWLTISNLIFRPRELVLIALVGFLLALIIRVYTNINRAQQIQIGRYGLLAGVILMLFSLCALICSLTLLAIGYGEHTSIYARTLLFPQLLYVFGITIAAASLSILLVNKFKPFVITVSTSLAILVFIALAPSYLNKIVSQLTSSIGYTSAWIDQESAIEQAKKSHSTTVYLPQSAAGIGDGFSLSCTGPYASSTEWLNEQIEEYYHIDNVCSDQDKPVLEKQ